MQKNIIKFRRLQAAGSKIKGRLAGTLSDIGSFSTVSIKKF